MVDEIQQLLVQDIPSQLPTYGPRNLHCHRFAVTHRHAPAADDPWTDGRFLGLTLALHRRITEGTGIETSIYAYDIDTYNRKREWNSPDDWANPQNFHRWRW